MFKQGYQHVRGKLKNETENMFYEKTYYCLKGYEKRVPIPNGILEDRAREIIRYVFEENPSFFQFSPYNICFIENAHGHFADFCYQYDKAEYNKCEMMIKKQLADYIQQSQILKLDSFNKIISIFNLIVNRGIYNQEIKKRINHGTIEDYSVVGLFRNGKAVCYGFAHAFKLLCDEVGIRCMIITGKLSNASNESHAWNLVECNHKFYHIDTTMVLDKNDILGRYQFFMVDSNWVSKTRIIDPKISLPEIGGLEYSIYFRYGFHCNTENDMNAYLIKMLSDHKRNIILHFDSIDSARVQTHFNALLKKYNKENTELLGVCYTFSELADYGLFCFTMNVL